MTDPPGDRTMKKRAIAALCILLLLLSLQPGALACAPENFVYLNSRAAIVIDYETGAVLFRRNMDMELDPASLTKIMTAYILFEEIAAGNLTMDTLIPVSEHAVHISTTIDHRAPFSEGAAYSVDTFFKLIFLPSSNAATIAVAEYISGSQEAFTERMNATAERLGMDARYGTAHGLWDSNRKTVLCAAILTRSILREFPEVLQYSSLESFLFYDTEYFNINRLLFDNEEIDGFKTGATATAGYCLVTTAERDGQRIIVVTLNAPTRADAFADSEDLLAYGFAALEDRDPDDLLADALAGDLPPENVETYPCTQDGTEMMIVILAVIGVVILGSALFVFLWKKRNQNKPPPGPTPPSSHDPPPDTPPDEEQDRSEKLTGIFAAGGSGPLGSKLLIVAKRKRDGGKDIQVEFALEEARETTDIVDYKPKD